MNVTSILLWGFGATIVLTTLTIAAQSFGLTRIDLPFIMGAMFTPDRDLARVIGYLLHLVNGWLFALVYALLFESVHSASAGFGAAIGFVQGIFVVVAFLPILPGIHPRMVSDSRGPQPTRLLEPPGFLALNYGRNTPIVLVLSHTIYGAIIGSFYALR
jgi:hypothetical protein